VLLYETKSTQKLKKEKMTDKEFDALFKSLRNDEILINLGEMIKSVTVKSGNSYAINNLSDLKAVVEQELYERYVI
jgi:hypothetical protein